MASPDYGTIFGLPLLLTEPDPKLPDHPIYTAEAQDDIHMTFCPPLVHSGLHFECCPLPRGCKKNLKDIPHRMVTQPSHGLVIDRWNTIPSFCSPCGLPRPNEDCFKQLVVEKMAMWNNWKEKDPGTWRALSNPGDSHQGVTQLWWEYSHRSQTRIAGQSSQMRKTHVNAIVIHPYHNIYRWLHQTFTLMGAGVIVKGNKAQTLANLEALLDTIFREAAGACHQDIMGTRGSQTMPLHCKCAGWDLNHRNLHVLRTPKRNVVMPIRRPDDTLPYNAGEATAENAVDETAIDEIVFTREPVIRETVTIAFRRMPGLLPDPVPQRAGSSRTSKAEERAARQQEAEDTADIQALEEAEQEYQNSLSVSPPVSTVDTHTPVLQFADSAIQTVAKSFVSIGVQTSFVIVTTPPQSPQQNGPPCTFVPETPQKSVSSSDSGTDVELVSILPARTVAVISSGSSSDFVPVRAVKRRRKFVSTARRVVRKRRRASDSDFSENDVLPKYRRRPTPNFSSTTTSKAGSDDSRHSAAAGPSKPPPSSDSDSDLPDLV
jgi:hypothetical protein